ncbi:mannose-6-phosphate isomerase, class I [Saccharothrix coeruleofusca]|uniref:mannose-6-phosphate isomerase n=1 Tax=Saccharothrix coeruleofusca TaxID=33919 RepID=A0A918AQN7_9PSEU|nr:mannose-6-phosphate isomerase, class I [Saccharothrix coeruleofusca]GGP69934.1 mannose-6-phosphate isomerase, class I [Saccharothrix coeruleofusca]
MDVLHNAVRSYAWGSRTALAEMLGREVPAPHPEAELWMGAHPGDPSRVVGPDGAVRSLLDLLAEDPRGQLGERFAQRWGGRLPFLLKVLAAEEALSLQAHPSAEQAALGFAAENAAGVPIDSPVRNYKDPSAKPELVCALTEFHALAGFRDPHRTVKLLRALEAPDFAPYTELLAVQPDANGLRALFTTLITLPQTALDALLPQVLDACVLHVKERGEFDAECRTALELGEAYPGDAGVLAALLLNRIVLQPGEAIFLPAGNLHAYLHGTGVEILANSDNVLRCGLTPKHVDVPELMRVLDFSCGDMPVQRGDEVSPGLWVYRTPCPEFELSRLEPGPGVPIRVDHTGPQILFCTRGEVVLTTARGERQALRRGQSVWLAAGDPPVLVEADVPAQLFRATAGAE